MINQNTIIVFDFETGGLDIPTLEPVQIAAVAIEPRSLEIKDTFPETLMKPLDMNNLNPRAMEKNKISREALKTAPDQKLVWQRFCGWVKSHNSGGGFGGAPIPCGKNVRLFDIPIANRLCKTYGFVGKGGEANIFHNRTVLELEDLLFMWFEDTNELESHSMDTVRKYFGMETEGAHQAMMDVHQTADLVVKFLKLHRRIRPKITFEGCCKKT